MTESFEFRSVTHFTAGAVGEPGSRVFYLQAGDESHYVSVKLEKQQVEALATFLRSVMDDLPSPQTQPQEFVDLIEPALPEWVVGQIAVGIDEADAEVVLVVEELVVEDEASEVIDVEGEESEGAKLRVHLTVEQATAFISTADALMNKGRPPCRLCGQPEDPGGHACPRLN